MKYKAKNLKPKVKKKVKLNKKVTIISSVALAVCLTAGGVWYYLGHSSSDPVYVYPFQYIGMTEYWGDSQESNGPVTTDKIQTVFLSDTQTVTEIMVKEGDQVKKGDLLMTFDTTLSDLQLERKRLEVEKLKLDLKQAQNRLEEINRMKPMEPPEFEMPEPTEPDPGDPINPIRKYEISDDVQYDGSTKEKSLICWLGTGVSVGNKVLGELKATATEYQLQNKEDEDKDDNEDKGEVLPPSNASALLTEGDSGTPGGGGGTPGGGDGGNLGGGDGGNPGGGGGTPGGGDGGNPGGGDGGNPGGGDGGNPGGGDGGNPGGGGGTPGGGDGGNLGGGGGNPDVGGGGNPDGGIGVTPPDGGAGTPPAVLPPQGSPVTPPGVTPPIALPPQEPPEGGEGGEEGGETPEPPELILEKFYVVFKTTKGDTTGGMTTMRQGMCVNVGENGAYSFTFFDAAVVPDHYPEAPEIVPPTMPEIDFGSGMTAAQIAQMRTQQKKTIKDLDFKIKMADTEYKIMEREVSDGNIYSEIDGSVVSLLTEEEAKREQQPVIKVSGGGGFYVEGAVNELDKDRLKIGQEVTVNDWRSGMTYTGTVKSIGDFPRTEDSWMGMGNPNASYYPFQVFVDESADLQEGSYVSVAYSAGVSENGVYLENPFIRTENGRSYCLILDKDGRLEKRYVTTGKALWSSYTEIRSGITAEDLIAFPYGKNVKPGVPAVEGDLSNLYS